MEEDCIDDRRPLDRDLSTVPCAAKAASAARRIALSDLTGTVMSVLSFARYGDPAGVSCRDLPDG